MVSTNVDLREQLFNDRLQGPVTQIQIPAERVTTLHGIMADIDPGILRPGNPWFPPAATPRDFHDAIRHVLDRHPLIAHAEVRASGTGLHVITWLDPPVELHSAAQQRYWDGIYDVVRASLPSDPNAPGITALTRPIGSVNGKNGATVECLRAGRPVQPTDVEAFAQRLVAAPFREVAQIFFGAERVSPCPICERDGSGLNAMDSLGKCYRCGNVGIERVFNVVYRPEPKEAGPDRGTSVRGGR
jgi:hypothetical protein